MLPADPDLALIVAAWDRLPEAVRTGIVAMVKAASGGWPMIQPSPSPRFRRAPEPPGRSLASHQKRAGLGCWAATRSERDRRDIQAWKRTTPFDPVRLDLFATALAGLVRAWSPILPPGTLVTVRPQGASYPGPYAAVESGRRVAELLVLPFAPILTRTDVKRWDRPHHRLRQAPFVADLPEPAPTMVLVVDDLVTTGATMRRSLEASRAAGVAAVGFGFSGV